MQFPGDPSERLTWYCCLFYVRWVSVRIFGHGVAFVDSQDEDFDCVCNLLQLSRDHVAGTLGTEIF